MEIKWKEKSTDGNFHEWVTGWVRKNVCFGGRDMRRQLHEWQFKDENLWIGLRGFNDSSAMYLDTPTPPPSKIKIN